MNTFFLATGWLLLCTAPLHAKSIRASQDPVRDEPEVTDEERSHWAFQPLRPGTGAIDEKIDAQLTRRGLHRSLPADPATLIRRVTFDLIGLPPLPEQVTAFEKSFAINPDAALSTLVDSLLASPAYGEHWAQWWLDLARFAESDGFEHDLVREQAWRFRDWVIDAFNRDLPFNLFVRQQVAGDLLLNGEPVATGFLLAGPDMPDINRQEERRHMILNEITGTVGSVFLGLTVSCAQCHDHAYDPLSQADFYRLRAFFDNAVPMTRDKPLGPEVRLLSDRIPDSVVFVRGDFLRPGPAVKPSFPRVIGNLKVEPTDRVALAHWLTSADNALFLRTTANRIWQQHFGRPLAPTPADLGHQSEPPTHPELLDWLAAELPNQGWSLKRLHKSIVMSATFRQATAGPDISEDAASCYAAMPRKRLTGEMLRDTLLSLSGQLNGKAHGPSVRLPLPAEVAHTVKKQKTSDESDPAELRRRSIYAFAGRNVRQPVFDLFDRPDALVTCAKRENATTAPQALLMMNSDLVLQTASALANCAPATDTEAVVSALVQRCFARQAKPEEIAAASSFFGGITSSSPAWRDRITAFCLALLNTNEFIYID